jgi:S-adenosylmethionine decarboxylase
MTEAAGFTLFDIKVHSFEPQGVTAAAIVGESHIALHSWPEDRSLFVDIASCTTMEAAARAVRVAQEAFTGSRTRRLATSFASGSGFQEDDCISVGK